MIQLPLFPAALVSCDTCGWTWKEGEQPPPDHEGCEGGEPEDG